MTKILSKIVFGHPCVDSFLQTQNYLMYAKNFVLYNLKFAAKIMQTGCRTEFQGRWDKR